MFHRPIPRPRVRVAAALVTLLALVAGLALGGPPPSVASGGRPGPAAPPPAPPPQRVATWACRLIDPNLVRGVCLAVPARGSARPTLTWIGSYRAPGGRVFFCIDYLYDSRLPGRARVVSTHGLVNQLGHRVGAPEVAALNALVSREAPSGSTGSARRDAAIALIVREVMSDGVRGDGRVVYPPGLRVGEAVRSPRGGLPAGLLGTARALWRTASRTRGPVRLTLTSRSTAPVRLGHRRTYDVAVVSAAGTPVTGLPVHLTCAGPVRCPASVRSAARPVPVRLRPRDVGRFTLTASVSAPGPDGRLYVAPGWHPHGGVTARDAGRQRGWIAGARRATAHASAVTRIERARPRVLTRASSAVALPGAELTDTVTVSGLPAHRHHPGRRYHHRVTARLYGPFDHAPGPQECTARHLAGTVSAPVDGNGTLTTPPVRIGATGRYTWQESLPGDRWTTPATTPCGLVVESTDVARLQPRVSTLVSARRVTVGGHLHDTVTVSGTDDPTGDQPVVAAWELRGPLAPGSDGCAGLDWTAAPRAAAGTLAFPGPGTHRTPGTVVRAAGCWSYAVTIAATTTTEPVAEPAGVPAETAVAVRRRPEVSTQVSQRRLEPGAKVRDVVDLRGLGRHDTARITWRLLGPVAPGSSGSCDGAEWSGAPTAAHGGLTAYGPGRLTTPAVVVPGAGCYTFVEHLAATPTLEPVTTAPGLASETLAAVRRALGAVPAVPSGPHGLPRDPRFYRGPARLVAPGGGRLQVPSVGIDAPVDRVGLDGRRLAVPGDVHHVGWLSSSAAAADRMGSSVIAGHVSDAHDRPGVLGRLQGVRPGALVVWTDAAGTAHRFTVVAVQRYARTQGLPAAAFSPSGRHLLRLVTCTDRRSLPGGRFHYADNLLVTAREVS